MAHHLACKSRRGCLDAERIARISFYKVVRVRIAFENNELLFDGKLYMRILSCTGPFVEFSLRAVRSSSSELCTSVFVAHGEII